MTRHALLAAIAGIALFNSTGCCLWKHCFGSWAQYGCEDTYGYCDGCPSGACGDAHGGWEGHSCTKCSHGHGAFSHKKHAHHGCNSCCNGLACCPPANAHHGCCNNCPGGHCGHHECPLACLKKLLCCCHDDCQGCGEKYCCDWINTPPCPDPCDCCGNFIGPHEPRPAYQSPRVGSVPLRHPQQVMHSSGEHFEGEYIEE